MLKSQTPSNDEIAIALQDNCGMVVDSARSLKVSKTWLYKKINDSKVLQDVLAEIRNDIVDEAEIKLRERIREGDTTAIIYTLKSMGKSRGWSQSNDWYS